jgi:methylamine dehydrogenase accessory protein MauD
MTAAFYISYAVLWALVIFQSLVLLGLVRTVYRADAEPATEARVMGDGELVGQLAPQFTARDVAGASVDNGVLAGRPSALLFVTPDCSSCTATLDEIEALRAKVDENVIVVCRAGPDECAQLRATYGLDSVPVLVDADREISNLFDVHVAPTAVLVSASGRIQTYGQPMRGEEFAEMIASGGAERVEAAH